ncbi:MAG: superoxide dismutase, Ni [Candidatus Levybacteria bacterium]|nr:superoxide dismutase, Ni [Candidatus Levybacteria bacterium]
MTRFLLKITSKLLPVFTAYAHCDVPCGIYDPKPAQIAAQTILKMVQKIKELPLPDMVNKEQAETYHNSITRFIWTKEEHARRCKEEILILWTDYFKPEHLQMFPDLHETFWKAAKLCSKNKQEVNLEAAQDLVKAVDEIADIFYKTKAPK